MIYPKIQDPKKIVKPVHSICVSCRSTPASKSFFIPSTQRETVFVVQSKIDSRIRSGMSRKIGRHRGVQYNRVSHWWHRG